MLRHLLLALLVIAFLMPGCRLKPRATMPALPRDNEVPVAQTGLRAVQVALHTRDSAKPAPDSVTVRLRWREQVLVSQTLGRGERWEPGSSRNVEFTLDPAIRMDSPGSLLLEIVKPDAASGRPPWGVRVEALGRLTDGGVLSLMEQTEPALIGGGRAPAATWVLHSR